MCNELGFQSGSAEATQYSQFGIVSEDFKMDNVECNGDESHIIQCKYLAKDDCVSSEGAGVICTG